MTIRQSAANLDCLRRSATSMGVIDRATANRVTKVITMADQLADVVETRLLSERLFARALHSARSTGPSFETAA